MEKKYMKEKNNRIHLQSDIETRATTYHILTLINSNFGAYKIPIKILIGDSQQKKNKNKKTSNQKQLLLNQICHQKNLILDTS